MKLSIELVPKSAWYSNVRSNVTKKEWDVLRKDCYKKADYKCEVCNGKGDKHPVECHEIWNYNDDNCTQTLEGLIALCPDCHMSKHPGLAQIKGKIETVIKQLSKVNKITYVESLNYLNESFDIWEKRSTKQWKLDISYLEKLK
jgi:hypothetical protein